MNEVFLVKAFGMLGCAPNKILVLSAGPVASVSVTYNLTKYVLSAAIVFAFHCTLL